MVRKGKMKLSTLFLSVGCTWARGSCGTTPHTKYRKKSDARTNLGRAHGKNCQVL